MSHKDDKHAARDVVAAVQTLEGVGFALSVQDDIVFDLLEHFSGRQLMVGEDLAFKVLRFVLLDVE